MVRNKVHVLNAEDLIPDPINMHMNIKLWYLQYV